MAWRIGEEGKGGSGRYVAHLKKRTPLYSPFYRRNHYSKCSWNPLYPSLSTFFSLHPETVIILILGLFIPMQVFMMSVSLGFMITGSQASVTIVFYPLILIRWLLICVHKGGPSQTMLAQLKKSTGLFFLPWWQSTNVYCKGPKDKYFSLCGL